MVYSVNQGLEELETCALVVDDTSTVWHHHKDSLLAVERYVYFPSSRQALNMTGESFLESGMYVLIAHVCSSLSGV